MQLISPRDPGSFKSFQYTERTHLSRKEVDDVLGGEDSWKNVDKTDGELEISHPSTLKFQFLFGDTDPTRVRTLSEML